MSISCVTRDRLQNQLLLSICNSVNRQIITDYNCYLTDVEQSALIFERVEKKQRSILFSASIMINILQCENKISR